MTNKVLFSNLEGTDVLEVKIDGVLTQLQPGSALEVDIERGATVAVFVTDPVAAQANFPADTAAASLLGGDGSE